MLYTLNGSTERIYSEETTLIDDFTNSKLDEGSPDNPNDGIAIYHENDNDTAEKEILLGREHFEETFDTNAYLRDFYTDVEDPAMQMVIFYLPNIVARIDNCKSLLDFGAGPTIHVAACFRETVEEIYLADFLAQNRAELTKWLNGCSKFNWTKTLKIIAACEGLNPLTTNLEKAMENATRRKVRDILFCNCHDDPPLEAAKTGRQTFDIITTFYTIEYCCETQAEYRSAIHRVASLLRSGGHFIMGSVLEENWCSFGGRKFKCLFITRQFVLDCLRDAGLDAADPDDSDEFDSNRVDVKKESNAKLIRSLEVNGMVLFCCRKRRMT